MKIINVFQESLGKSRFIGLKYTNQDRDQYGSFGAKWMSWFKEKKFSSIEKLAIDSPAAYVGLMRSVPSFEYWIGVFCPENTTVPDGYQYIDIKELNFGTCWLYGNESTGELYGPKAHQACVKSLVDAGMIIDQNGWCFERYVCPRFTKEDEHGKVILDYCITIKKK